MLDDADWYTHVSIIGRVVEMKDDDGLADIDRLSTHYGHKPYRNRTSPRVSAWIEVDRWHGWGAAVGAGALVGAHSGIGGPTTSRP